MSDIAIRVENLSKLYHIVVAKHRHDTLRDKLAEGLKSVFRRNGRSNLGESAFWALKDVSFEIKEGEVVGIIGQNGAGKSTLLKVLSQIVVPTSGQAQIFGRVGSLLEVGTGFHPELTGRENIFLNGAIMGMKKEEIRRQFDAIVEFAEIEKFLDVPVKRYSSGMYVRLAFAVAAHLQPEIMFVDEVLAVGDAAFQKKCLGKMGDVAKGGRTVLFVSHNMTAVNSLCKRVIWLNGGEIVEDGSSALVLKNYLRSFENSVEGLQEIWDDMDAAPGNEMVRLHSVRVRSLDGCPLTMETPFKVDVEYWNLVEDAHLHIALFVYTAAGIMAFATGRPTGRPLQAGLLRSVCCFPGNLLNSGPYRFVVYVVKNESSIIYTHESRVAINILDLREKEVYGFDRSPGVVQPVLEWVTEYLGADLNIKASSGENRQKY